MTYFIVIRNNYSYNEGQKSKFLDKLQYLESGISNEIDRRDKLLKTISEILKSKIDIENSAPTEPITLIEEHSEAQPIVNVQSGFDTVKSNFKLNLSDGTPVIAILLMACNRVRIFIQLIQLLSLLLVTVFYI
jgi:hypothetical protein